MIYHFKSLVLVRKGRAFYTTLYQEVFLGNPGGGRVLKLWCGLLFASATNHGIHYVPPSQGNLILTTNQSSGLRHTIIISSENSIKNLLGVKNPKPLS